MNIDYLEIEMDGYCNRRCPFCPNSLQCVNRQQPLPMTDDIFYRLIDDLAISGYRHPISFSRYNENYYNADFFHHRLKYVRDRLPNCRLTSASNGDFVTAEMLRESANCGLHFLMISYYPSQEDATDFTECLTTFLARLVQYRSDNDKIQINTEKDHVYAEWHIDKMKVRFESRYNTRWSSNRGGTVIDNTYRRTTPCHSTRLYIDYNGNVMPCCHARSDVPAHAPLILGNLQKQSIIQIEGGESYRQMQRDLQNPKTLPVPCRSCNAHYQGGW